MARLILIRHGETDWNLQHRYQGHMDIALNETGYNQAESIAAYLKKTEMVDAVYSSDLKRCRQTAGIVAGAFGLKVGLETGLREIKFGEWEGLQYQELQHVYADDFQSWFADPVNYPVPGGESFRMVLERFLPVIERIAHQHTGTVAVCSHGGAIRAFINHLDPQYGYWDRSLHPGTLSIISCEKRGCQVLAAEFLPQ